MYIVGSGLTVGILLVFRFYLGASDVTNEALLLNAMQIDNIVNIYTFSLQSFMVWTELLIRLNQGQK